MPKTNEKPESAAGRATLRYIHGAVTAEFEGLGELTIGQIVHVDEATAMKLVESQQFELVTE